MNTDTDTRAEADMPSTDMPSTDGPSTDGPSTDAPSTDGPSTDGPSTDVSAATAGWLRQATTLATDHGLDDVAAALESLAAGLGRRTLRLAVVGEPGKGKSTLINRLLGRNLLPTGSTAAMRPTVVVGPGQADALSLTWPDGRTEQRAIGDPDAWHAPATWHDLTGDATAGLTVRDDWLADHKVEFVDTPGLSSADQDGRDLLRHTIAGCDGALFVVSAVAPLSITELRLLEEEVLTRHLPFVAVVVTMLDLIDEAERAETLEHIQSRLTTVPGHPIMVIGPGRTGGEAELDRLRVIIEHQALNPDRMLWRDRRIAAHIADHCVTMANRAAEAMAAQRLAAGEHGIESARAMDLLEAEAQDWETLRLKLVARQLELGTRLRECVQQQRLDLVELRRDLENAPDPQVWWTRTLPLRLRAQLSTLAKRAERLILSGLATDLSWLDDEVRKRLPTAEPSPPPTALNLEIVPELAGEVSDLSRIRLATRLGAQGSAIIGYLLTSGRVVKTPTITPIFGVAFSVLGGLLAEASIRSATEQQRREVDMLLIRAVNESTSTFTEQASTILATAYAPIFTQLGTHHLTWHQARLAALNAGAHPDQTDQAEWSALARASTALAAGIRSAPQG